MSQIEIPKWDPRHPEFQDYKGPVHNPAAAHIPRARHIPRRVLEFPWRVVGSQILLFMMTNEERSTTSGIVIPAVRGHLGKEKERTYSMIMAFGAGEVTPSGAYISPEHDYELYLGAVCMIDPEAGTRIQDDTFQYRKITVWDVVAVLDPAYGQGTYTRLRERAALALEKYTEDPDDVNFTHQQVQGIARPSYEQGLEEAVERTRRRFGDATTSSYAVNGLKKE